MDNEDIQVAISGDLKAELIKMRRNPEHFRVFSSQTCQLCGGKEKRALHLKAFGTEKDAGSWCPVHGWLSFDSVSFPPTERLTVSEIEDQRLRQRRQAEFATRKPQQTQKETQ